MNTNNISNQKTSTPNNNIRFTFLINPKLLSQIKLISYISNHKLYETINSAIQLYITNYNKTHNTDITNLINLNSNPTNNNSSPLNPTTNNQPTNQTTPTKK